MSYNKCICLKCKSQYATVIQDNEDIMNDSCPRCGEKQLKISGPMSYAETSGLFHGGG